MTTNEHEKPLTPGEIRRHTVGGRTFQVMHVSGGAFTQASVRGATGPAEVISTNRFETMAVHAYAGAIAAAEDAYAQGLTDVSDWLTPSL